MLSQLLNFKVKFYKSARTERDFLQRDDLFIQAYQEITCDRQIHGDYSKIHLEAYLGILTTLA
jgi:hypothetical protein